MKLSRFLAFRFSYIHFVVLALCLFLPIQSETGYAYWGDCMQCYDCDSISTPECSVATSLAGLIERDHVKRCCNENKACRYFKQTVESKTRVIRGCGSVEGLLETKKCIRQAGADGSGNFYGVTCICNNRDKCNSSFRMSINVVMLVIGLFVAIE